MTRSTFPIGSPCRECAKFDECKDKTRSTIRCAGFVKMEDEQP